MKSYHIFTSWGAELGRPGFDTLSEAIEMAGEICADTFMLDGEEMELQVERVHADFQTPCCDGASHGKGRHA